MNATTDRCYVTHLSCSKTGERYAAGELHNLSAAGAPLLVHYDLAAIAQNVPRDALSLRPQEMWRYRELLPLARMEHRVSLGEQVTPLVDLPSLAAMHDATALTVKDESRLPTGSFKARGLVMAVSMAHELGVTDIAIPTNGNAGAALSAYASRAGIRSHVFCPRDTPEINMLETAIQGGEVHRVDGFINDCGRLVGELKREHGWFEVSTLKEP
jgi:threonine synthase